MPFASTSPVSSGQVEDGKLETIPLMTTMKQLARQVLHRVDVDIVRYRKSTQAVRIRILRHVGVTVVLDVGANSGQYVQLLRRSGYGGRIVSFEPLSVAFAELSQGALGDPLWDCRRLAIGDEEGTTTIHVAGNSWSSSLLPMLDRHGTAPASVDSRG